MKICKICKKEKLLDSFTFRKDSNKYRNECKDCIKIRNKKYYSKNKSKVLDSARLYRKQNKNKISKKKKMYYKQNKDGILEYRKNNKDKIKEYRDGHNKEYYSTNKDKILEQKKEYANKNADSIKKYQEEWRKNNQNYIKEYAKEYNKNNRSKMSAKEKERRRTDIIFRLRKVLRSRLSNALKHRLKTGSAVSDLGCSVEYLVKYLEGLFKLGMSWDNYGSYWHIDHIRPLASFDLTDYNQFKQACNYTNLQPMWAKENISKGKKWEPK